MDAERRGLGISLTPPPNPSSWKITNDMMTAMHGQSFQDCTWIQDFEADFLWKVSLKILNLTDSNIFFGLFSVYLKTIDYLKLEIVDIYRQTASFKIWFSKVQDFWSFELSPKCNAVFSLKSHLCWSFLLEYHNYRKCSKFWTLVARQKFQDKQRWPRSGCFSEAVWSGFPLFAILTSILLILALKASSLWENGKRIFFRILVHLRFSTQ